MHPELASKQWRRDDPPYAGRETDPLKTLADHRFGEQLSLKVGTLVILLHNLDHDHGLVNGSQGKVVGFRSEDEFKPRELVGAHKQLRTEQEKLYTEALAEKEWPVVKFNNGLERVIRAHCQLSELGQEKPYSLMGRTQVPLLHAWAMTVHKAQGMTLERAEVDLSRSFEREMVYVALSRAKTLAGLRVHALPQYMDEGPNIVNQEFLDRFIPAHRLS